MRTPLLLGPNTTLKLGVCAGLWKSLPRVLIVWVGQDPSIAWRKEFGRVPNLKAGDVIGAALGVIGVLTRTARLGRRPQVVPTARDDRVFVGVGPPGPFARASYGDREARGIRDREAWDKRAAVVVLKQLLVRAGSPLVPAGQRRVHGG